MTVYVDNVKIPWRGMLMSHMTADSIEELHAFAASIGLKRAWAQLPPEHSIPHYDVSEGKRRLAIKRGAVEEDWRSSEALDRHHKMRVENRRTNHPPRIVKRRKGKK
jgi:hypothetical protein